MSGLLLDKRYDKHYMTSTHDYVGTHVHVHIHPDGKDLTSILLVILLSSLVVLLNFLIIIFVLVMSMI